jgi:Cys-tRNA(Pro)/Cys-tRNA(Cys) deacylase
VAKSKKTLAMRVLEGQDVAYEAVAFPDSIHDAVGVADHVGVPRDHVYKTLVVEAAEPGFKPMLIMIAGDQQLDLKRVAQAVGAKKAHMATQADAERLTHLKVGGISALALLNRGFDVYIDEPALELDYVVVSAGKRGHNLRLSVEDLIAVTGAQPIDATGSEEME